MNNQVGESQEINKLKTACKDAQKTVIEYAQKISIKDKIIAELSALLVLKKNTKLIWEDGVGG